MATSRFVPDGAPDGFFFKTMAVEGSRGTGEHGSIMLRVVPAGTRAGTRPADDRSPEVTTDDLE